MVLFVLMRNSAITSREHVRFILDHVRLSGKQFKIKEKWKMTWSVLVAYASRYGATAEIAVKIGETLAAAGLVVDVREIDDVVEFSSYTAVVLGSAVYAGMWQKNAVKFLKREEANLAARPVWFFSSGPTGEGDPVELMDGWTFPEAQQELADRIGPRDIAVFHGKIDVEKLNMGERMVVKAVRAQTGDYRDWKMVVDWATEIAKAICA